MRFALVSETKKKPSYLCMHKHSTHSIKMCLCAARASVEALYTYVRHVRATLQLAYSNRTYF